ncbi:MAG: GDP-mannose 4,6-dehydratase [Planctomycetota bacterium]
MHIVITGGAGFIGSHLAEAFLDDGAGVTAVDDLSTGARKNIEHLRENPRFDLVIENVANEGVLDHLVRDADAVCHLAAAVGVRLIVEDPVRTIETNILGTEVALKVAARYGARLFIASSSEVYGKNDALPFAEDSDMVLGPTTHSRWCYACSKAIDEFLALAYHRERGLPVVIGRFFNTVGPRQTGQYGMVVPRFVQQALAGDPITVYGDGEQTRCFCHVSDVVAAVSRLMFEPKAEGGIFNIGSDEGITINRLAEKVKTITGSSSDIIHVPYEEAYEEGFEDMRSRQPDVSRVKDLVGFEVTRDVDQIIRDVVEHFRQQSSVPRR